MQAHGVTPILNVSDLDASFAWFGKLGWAKLWEWGDPPDFGAVGNGGCEIFLSADGQGARGFWLTVWVGDVDAVLETCLAEGILVIRPPKNEPWGVRELHVRHPDGHVLRISRGTVHDHDHPHDHDHQHDQHHHHGHDRPDELDDRPGQATEGS
jgi:catechol 2,3-dioxygenase-like lactoylglutathione lyase family enzyme